MNRRTLLRGLAAAGVAPWLPAISSAAVIGAADVPGGFQAVIEGLPANPMVVPQPPVAVPWACASPVYDIFGNHWCLGSAEKSGNRGLLVLAAQSPQSWTVDKLSQLPDHPWQFLAADEFGYLWVASNSRCMRLDPHTPEDGWLDLTDALLGGGRPLEQITALGIAASGAAIAALESIVPSGQGSLAEIDHTAHTTVKRTPAPRGIVRLACDEDGNLWLQGNGTVYRKAPDRDAWQRRWQLVDRLPAGNHDLSGDVLDGRFYMAGGQNAGWGYPAKPHVFHDLMAFDPADKRWSVAAALDQPRYYNGTSYLDGKVWVVAGYTRDAQYNPVTLRSVEIWDPATKQLSAGPALPFVVDNPVALHIAGRIYLAGCKNADKDEHPCYLLSIGTGETAWRREPDGPAFHLALAATAYQNCLYLALPNRGLGRYDTKQRAWSLIPLAHAARSPQMATYQNEIWIMGGRDIERQDQITIYKPGDGSWAAGPDLPRDLAWGAGTVVGGELLVVGGAAGRSYNNRTFCLRKQPLSS